MRGSTVGPTGNQIVVQASLMPKHNRISQHQEPKEKIYCCGKLFLFQVLSAVRAGYLDKNAKKQ